MKKQILISLILVSSAISLNAQIYTPGGTLQGSSGNNNVGIGTASPSQNLQIGVASNTVTNMKNTILIGQNYFDGDYMSAMNVGGGNNDVYALQIRNFGRSGQVVGTLDYRLGIDNLGGNFLTAVIGTASNHPLTFSTNATQRMTILPSGNVGIGTTSPSYKLDVCGTIRAKEVKVDLLGGCDFVFKPDYKLMDLKTLEQFVKTNQHLPEIASEKEMVDNGINMKEMQMKLLQKMEEITLYIIEQNKKLEQQNQEMKEMKERLKN